MACLDPSYGWDMRSGPLSSDAISFGDSIKADSIGGATSIGEERGEVKTEEDEEDIVAGW